MKRSIVTFLFLMGASLSALAAPEKIDARGEPAIQPGKETGFYVWADKKSLHLRWTGKDKPVLFTGSAVVSGGLGDVKRINQLAGGWIDKKDENNFLFSATATTGLDGADIALPSGGTVTLDLLIDGEAPDMNLVFIGAKGAHPTAVPVKFPAK